VHKSAPAALIFNYDASDMEVSWTADKSRPARVIAWLIRATEKMLGCRADSSRRWRGFGPRIGDHAAVGCVRRCRAERGRTRHGEGKTRGAKSRRKTRTAI